MSWTLSLACRFIHCMAPCRRSRARVPRTGDCRLQRPLTLPPLCGRWSRQGAGTAHPAGWMSGQTDRRAGWLVDGDRRFTDIHRNRSLLVCQDIPETSLCLSAVLSTSERRVNECTECITHTPHTQVVWSHHHPTSHKMSQPHEGEGAVGRSVEHIVITLIKGAGWLRRTLIPTQLE